MCDLIMISIIRPSTLFLWCYPHPYTTEERCKYGNTSTTCILVSSFKVRLEAGHSVRYKLRFSFPRFTGNGS